MTSVALFWAGFRASCRSDAVLPATTCFSDSAAQQDELCHLVLIGIKRATASLARWYNEKEPLPTAGDLAIVLDGSGTPRCVIETSHVHVAPFNSADEAFAAAEGEGDGSLFYWIAEHRRFFAAALAQDGLTFSDTEDIVFEHFKLIWRPGQGENHD